MLLSNLTFQPCPHHPKCPGFAVDVYCGPCCGAQEHTHHVECLAPQTSSIFQFTAPWHRWPAGLPAAVMLADAEVKQTQRLVWHVSTHVRISLLWAATLFFFLKDVGSSPPQHHIWFASTVSVVKRWTMAELQQQEEGRRGRGVLNIGQAVKTELQSENKSYSNSNHH